MTQNVVILTRANAAVLNTVFRIQNSKFVIRMQWMVQNYKIRTMTYFLLLPCLSSQAAYSASASSYHNPS
jgi:hypothetical protein